MGYIKRTLESKILEISRDYGCLLLIGPRQTGKTTMLEHLMEGTDRTKVTLDDVEERRLAKNEPELFLQMHPAPLLIDEVQYAPELRSRWRGGQRSFTSPRCRRRSFTATPGPLRSHCPWKS